MDLAITGRVALVAGGTGYIGQAIVAALREEGATVIAASRSSAAYPLDIGDADDVGATVARIVAEHGRIDIVVMAAGAAAQTLDPQTLSDPAAVLAAIDAKGLGTLRVANAVLPGMRERGWGRFIAVNGQNTYISGAVLPTLRNASLAFVAKTLADAYAGTGVTVNLINPGRVVDEPAPEPAAAGPGESSPAQIAALACFLASEAAGAISGEAVATGHKMHGFATY